MKAKLVARNPSNGTVTLYAEYRQSDKFKRVPTGVKTTPAKWDNEKQQIRLTGNPLEREEGKGQNATIQAVKKNLNEAVTALYVANGNIYPSIPQLNDYLAQEEATIEAIATEAPEATLVTELNSFITGKTDWAPATVKAFNTLCKHIQGYQKAKKVTWLLSTLSNEEITNWQHWLLKTYDFNNATLGKLVGKLKTFLTDKQPQGINLSKVKPLHSQMLTPPVVLHQQEIEAIRALDLAHSPRLDRVRDLMVAQIFSGLRFSDLIRLEARHIQKNHIVIRMQKTGKTVKIPCFPAFLGIIAKYTDSETGELHLPRLSNTKFNDYIKEVTQLVPELLKPIAIEYKKRNVTGVKELPKWKFITSHSSRRSFCSLCLDLDYSVKETMVWSGHSTLAAFSRYIGLSELKETAADDFAARYAAKLAK